MSKYKGGLNFSLTKACRLCLSHETNMNSLLKSKFFTLLETITRQTIQTQGTSMWVCRRCEHYLKKLSIFHNLCCKAEEFWETYCKDMVKTENILMIHLNELKKQWTKMCVLVTTETVNFSVEYDSNCTLEKYTLYSQNQNTPYDDTCKDVTLINDDVSQASPNMEIKKDPDSLVEIPLVILNDWKDGQESAVIDKREIDDTNEDDDPICNEESIFENKYDPDENDIPQHNDSVTDVKKSCKSFGTKDKILKIEIKEKNSINKSSKMNIQENVTVPKDFSTVSMMVGNEGMQLVLNQNEQLQELLTKSKGNRYTTAKYKCNKCIIVFRSESNLNAHLEKHQPSSGPISCPICTQRFPSEECLNRHSLIHSLRVKCLLCGFCTESHSKFLQHIASHRGEKFECADCGKVLRKKKSLLVHRELEHNDELKYKCKFCPKAFPWKYMHAKHELTHEKKRTFTCDECGKVLKNEYLLKKHLKKHQNKRDSYCVECDAHFYNLTALRFHYATVAKHKLPQTLKFSCERCPKRFETQDKLSHHIKNFHDRVKQYSCDKCGLGYASRKGLVHHTRMIHMGFVLPLKYPCHQCDKIFSSKTQLTCHIRKHTGEQPFQCEECLRRFSQKSSMKTHIKLVHLKMKRNRNCKGDPWGKNSDIIGNKSSIADTRKSKPSEEDGLSEKPAALQNAPVT